MILLKYIRLLFVILLCSLFFASCSECDIPEEDDDRTARSTLLVYMMAENNLDNWSKKDLNELFAGAKYVPDDCDLFAFVDNNSTPFILRYYSKNGVSACDTVIEYKEDFYSSDIVEMGSVLDDLLSKYPTEKLNLVLWSHGDGWMKFNKVKSRAIGYDNGENSTSGLPSKASIEIEDLALLLEGLEIPVETLMFDACFMQCVEVAYELRNSCKYILASPAEIPANGAPYDNMIKEFFATEINPYGLMMSYANGYSVSKGVVLSVIECAHIEQFAECVAAFVPQYFPYGKKIDTSNLFAYLKKHSSWPEFFDMNGIAKSFFTAEDYAEWKNSFNKMVVCSYAADNWETMYSSSYIAAVNKEQFGGVSMYLPMEDGRHYSLNNDFATLSWYGATAWDVAGW